MPQYREKTYSTFLKEVITKDYFIEWISEITSKNQKPCTMCKGIKSLTDFQKSSGVKYERYKPRCNDCELIAKTVNDKNKRIVGFGEKWCNWCGSSKNMEHFGPTGNYEYCTECDWIQNWHKWGNSDFQTKLQNHKDWVQKIGTETTKLVQAEIRVGQDKLRELNLNFWNNKCPVTGIADVRFLKTSHMLPWSKYEDHRLEFYNTVLLSSLYDDAFDAGFITFTDAGNPEFSSQICKRAKECLESSFETPINWDSKHLEFLHRHQNEVFLG